MTTAPVSPFKWIDPSHLVVESNDECPKNSQFTFTKAPGYELEAVYTGQADKETTDRKLDEFTITPKTSEEVSDTIGFCKTNISDLSFKAEVVFQNKVKETTITGEKEVNKYTVYINGILAKRCSDVKSITMKCITF